MPNLQQRQSDTSNDGKYCLPSQSVVDIVDTPRDPTLGISPNGRWLSFWDNPPLKSIEEVSQQEIKVAGKRLSRYFTSSLARISFYTGLSFKELPDLQKPLPANEAFGQSAKWRVSDKTKGNSFDGTSSLFVGYNSHMIRCENQFTDSKRIVQSKHLKGGVTKKIDIQNILNIFHSQKKQTIDAFSKMQKTSISERDIYQLIRLIIGKKEFDGPNKKEEKIIESIDQEMTYFGKNAWGLFNGITHYTSNVINRGRHSFGNVSGESQRINKIAMNFLISLN